MKSLIAFIKKEFTEQLRSGRLMILGLLFVLFGIMNPAVAKLTPWLLEAMADSMEESGMIITAVEVDAMTSWVQFFKNVPMALIAFVLITGNAFTKEYGMTVNEFINETRLEEAAKLTSLTDMTFYEISAAVGFSDQSYFSKVFSASSLTFKTASQLEKYTAFSKCRYRR